MEGLDEIAIERQRNDDFFVDLTECVLLEEATILITSRPQVCENLPAGRRVEIIGFGMAEIKEFAEKFFESASTVHEFLLQIKQFPHICSLCYVPMNLVMIADIFQVTKNKLPSTVTELYQLFVVMTLVRQIKNGRNKMLLSSIVVPTDIDKMLHRMLKGIPKEAVSTVFALSKLAYFGFFEWCKVEAEPITISRSTKSWSYPKVVFAEEDLIQCGIETTAEWDGFGLLKVTHTHDLPTDAVTYNFTHLTIQEFMCAVYISTLSGHEQQLFLSKHLDDYSTVLAFYCGLTKLASPAASQFVHRKL